MNTELHTADHAATNPLYIRMRNRFDFSGNRTIGEFMTDKAIREGFSAPEEAQKSKRRASRRPLATIAAFILSGAILLFGGIGVADAITSEPTPPSDNLQNSIRVNSLTDPSAVSLIFPNDTSDMTAGE